MTSRAERDVRRRLRRGRKARRASRRADRRFYSRRGCRRDSHGSHYRVRPVQRDARMAETRYHPLRTIITLAILIYTDGCFGAGGKVSCATRDLRLRATGGCPGIIPSTPTNAPAGTVSAGGGQKVQIYYTDLPYRRCRFYSLRSQPMIFDIRAL